MSDQSKAQPTAQEEKIKRLLLELMKFRKTPAQAPQHIVAEIVSLIDSSYKSLGLYGCGAEAFIIKVETALVDERCLKIVYPSDGIEGQRTITLWERVSSLGGGMTTDYSIRNESISTTRFLQAAQIQSQIYRAIQEAKINFFTVPAVYKLSKSPLYVEMEWMPSVPVLQWLHEKKDILTSLQCFCNLCKAVGFFHDRGIIHRDLKPDNIYIWNNLGVCILDWSVSKPIGDRNLTLTGMFIGSRPFISPVQAEMAKTATHLDDIHCLGYVFAAFMMDKDLPTVLDTKMEYSKLLEKYRKKIVSELPEAMQTIFLKATEADENNRYQSADDMREDVEKLIISLSPQTKDVFVPQPSVVVKPQENPLNDATEVSTQETPQPSQPKKIFEMGYFETLALARHLSDHLVNDCVKDTLAQGMKAKCEADTCDNCRKFNESIILLITKIISTMKQWGYL